MKKGYVFFSMHACVYLFSIVFRIMAGERTEELPACLNALVRRILPGTLFGIIDWLSEGNIVD